MFTFARRLESIAAAEARREALVKECEGRKQCRASIRSAAATTTLFTDLVALNLLTRKDGRPGNHHLVTAVATGDANPLLHVEAVDLDDNEGKGTWLSLEDASKENTCEVLVKMCRLVDMKHFEISMRIPRGSEEEDEDEDEEIDPHWVISVPHDDGRVNAVILVESRGGREEEGDVEMEMKLTIYVVDGEEYARCDDPVLFWTEENMHDELVLRRNEPGCVVTQLRTEMVYMVVPDFGEKLGEFEVKLDAYTSADVQVDVMVDEEDSEFELELEGGSELEAY